MFFRQFLKLSAERRYSPHFVTKAEHTLYVLVIDPPEASS